MDQGLKVAILCSGEELGKEAYKSISSMPTDNYVHIFVVEKNKDYTPKTLEEHFDSIKKKMLLFMKQEDQSEYFCYITNVVVRISDFIWLTTIACRAFKGEDSAFGTSGLLMIKPSDVKRLEEDKISFEHLFETPFEERVREAVNNARAALN